jgi:hypothetical protein
MSVYKCIECDISSEEAIIAGLLDMGLLRSEIRVSEKAENLQGYHGDRRVQRANITVPRATVNRRFSGGSSNDLGFEKKEDGHYDIHISDYDVRWWQSREKRFKRIAVAHQAEAEAKRMGYKVQRTDNGTTIQLKLVKY